MATSPAKKLWQQERRAALNALKLERGGCVDCGYNEHPAALHWDHVGDGKAAASRHAIHRNWAWARILAEIEKCELVCANCHAIRTAMRGYTSQPAGRRPLVQGEFGRAAPRSPRRELRSPRTHCAAGHPLDETNTYVTPQGRRRCRRCNTEAHQRYRAQAG